VHDVVIRRGTVVDNHDERTDERRDRLVRGAR